MKVTPETLTDEMVRRLSRHVPPGDPLHHDLNWHFASYVPREHKHEARQRICDAINARTVRP